MPTDRRLTGILSLADARPVLFQSDLDDLLLAGDIAGPAVQIGLGEDLYAGLLKILSTGCGEIPVTDETDGRLVGQLRHADLLRAYHREIANQQEDEE